MRGDSEPREISGNPSRNTIYHVFTMEANLLASFLTLFHEVVVGWVSNKISNPFM